MTITGGPIFWILLVLTVAAFVVYCERFMELRRAQVDYQDFIKGVFNVLEAGRTDEALAVCEDAPSPVSSVTATAIRQCGDPIPLWRESVDAQGRAEIARLARRLASLFLLAQVAPLLGLLGTVFGLMKTVLCANAGEIVFRADLMEATMKTLTVAALGLIVAVLANVMHGSLRLRLDRIEVELEAAKTQVLARLTVLRDQEGMEAGE